MDGPPTGDLALLPYLIPVVVLGIILVRGTRPRPVQMARMWIAPMMITALTVLILSQQGPPSGLGLAIYLVCLILGVALGWWRGRSTLMTADPLTGARMIQSSPLGLGLLAAIFALRYGARSYAMTHSNQLHLSIVELTDAFLLLAVGLVCAQRLELWLRARRLTAM